MKKAVIVNTNDNFGGGASSAGFAIMESLNTFSDYQTSILCFQKKTAHPSTFEIGAKKYSIFRRLFIKIKTKIYDRLIGADYWHPSLKYLHKNPVFKNADIINLHNIHGSYFSYNSIKKLRKIAPVVVTMQDMWYLTGHCAYTYGCERYYSGCEKCPHLDYYPEIYRDTARFHARQKKRIFSENGIRFISCSQWLIGEAKKSSVLKDRFFYHVFNPIRTDIFKPLTADKKNLRRALEIPEELNIICFGAFYIDDPRKGFLKFLKNIKEEFIIKNNIYFIAIGHERAGMKELVPMHIPIKYIGGVDSLDLRNLLYNVSDLLIFPTIADDLPNMLIESLSAGVPVVTFDVGGNKEVVKTGYTGFLANEQDYEEFNQGIENILLNPPLRRQMSINARNFIEQNFSYQACAKNYENIFNDMIDAKNTKP